MKLKRFLCPSLGVVALVLTAVAISGCGSASGDEDSQTYEQVLTGLKKAALSGGTYKAAKRAQDFKVGERDVIRSFCEFAWQIGANNEAWKLPVRGYADQRVRTGAFSRGNAQAAAINAAIGKLNGVITLEALTGEQLRRYTKACYR